MVGPVLLLEYSPSHTYLPPALPCSLVTKQTKYKVFTLQQNTKHIQLSQSSHSVFSNIKFFLYATPNVDMVYFIWIFTVIIIIKGIIRKQQQYSNSTVLTTHYSDWKYFHELHFISHIGWNFCIDIRFSIAFSLLGFE